MQDSRVKENQEGNPYRIEWIDIELSYVDAKQQISRNETNSIYIQFQELNLHDFPNYLRRGI